MMTTASIDLNLDVSSGGLAVEAPVGGVPVGGADVAASAFAPCPDATAVAAFARALARPIAENAALTREIRKAIASLDAAFPLRASASPCETSPLPSAPVAVGLTRSHGETEVLGETVFTSSSTSAALREPALSPPPPSEPLRASPRIAPASQLASLGGYVPPCEISPLPSAPVAVGLTRSHGETEIPGETVSTSSSTTADSAALREPALSPPPPSEPLRASDSPCETSPLPSAPVAVDLTRSHGVTEILGENVSVRAQVEVASQTDKTRAEPQSAQSCLDTGKPVPEISTPSPLPLSSSSTSAASAALREPALSPPPPSEPLRASVPPCEISPLPSAPVAVDLTRRHGGTETEGTERAEAAVVAPQAVPQPVVPPPVAPLAAEASPAPAVTPVEVVRTQAAQPPLPTQVLVQAAQAVADTLLVSPGLLRGQGEVVVQLRPDVLEGTEVRIAVTGRQLDVQFQPKTVDMAVLLENCRTQIANHLTAKIATFNVTVDVRKKRG